MNPFHSSLARLEQYAACEYDFISPSDVAWILNALKRADDHLPVDVSLLDRLLAYMRSVEQRDHVILKTELWSDDSGQIVRRWHNDVDISMEWDSYDDLLTLLEKEGV